MNTVAVVWAKGQYNPAGTTQVWYAFPEDVATFPTLADPSTATTFSSLASYADAITMKTGKQFQPLYGTPETGDIKCALVGSRDGKGYENSVSSQYPGNDATFLGFQAYIANRDVILIVREKNGTLRVLGDLDDPASLDTAAGESGAKIADQRKTVLTFKCSAATPAPIYASAIDSLLVAAA